MLPWRWRFSKCVRQLLTHAFMNSFLRVASRALADRGRQTRTMDDASALAPSPIWRLSPSVRIGHVPVIEKLALIKPSSIVSQPVDATGAMVDRFTVIRLIVVARPTRDCLNA